MTTTQRERMLGPEPGDEPDRTDAIGDAIAAAQRGEIDVRTTLEISAPFVRRLSRRASTSRADADDIEQQTLVALALHLQRIDPPAVTGWLAVVVTHEASRLRSRQARHVPLDGVADPTGAPDSRGLETDSAENEVVGFLDRNERAERVRDALDRLPAGDRELLHLLVASERPDYRRVSRLTGRSIGGIGPSRQRALDRLRSDPAIAAIAASR